MILGRCHHFDQDGLHVDVCWTECVPISVTSWKISQANWNYLLTIFSDKTQWSSARYDLHKFICLTTGKHLTYFCFIFFGAQMYTNCFLFMLKFAGVDFLPTFTC